MGKGAQLLRTTVNIFKKARSPDSQNRALAEYMLVPSKIIITTVLQTWEELQNRQEA